MLITKRRVCNKLYFRDFLVPIPSGTLSGIMVSCVLSLYDVKGLQRHTLSAVTAVQVL